MRWMDFVREIPKNNDYNIGYIFPVQLTPTEDLKQALNIIELPSELEELLKETDGILETMDGTVIDHLIWPVEMIIAENKRMRAYPEFKDLYMSFDQLLFFAGAGNGDLFAFVVLEGRVQRNDVFVWNHEDDSRTWAAQNLQSFLNGWISGEITT